MSLDNDNNLIDENYNLQDKLSKLILFFAIYTMFFVLFTSTIRFTLPFVLAAIFALILKKTTKYLIKKLKMKSWLASLISTVIFFSLFIVTLVLIISSLTSELISVAKTLQEFLSSNSPTYFSELGGFFEKIVANLDLIDPSVWSNIVSTATESLNKFLQVGISGVTSLVTSLFSFFGYVPYIGMVIAFTLLSTYFFTEKITTTTTDKISNIIPSNSKKILNATKHGKKMLTNYILAYMFLIFLSMFITFIGFLIFKVNYALLLSILAGLLDLLPIVGMACIYIPLILYFLYQGNLFVAIGLIVLYVLVFVSRQLLEPKIMSSSLGISPISTLAAMFIGLQLNGLMGMIFCMFLVVCYTVLKKVEIL